jgi:hypothetical protein
MARRNPKKRRLRLPLYELEIVENIFAEQSPCTQVLTAEIAEKIRRGAEESVAFPRRAEG